jgi:hypothetical protein
VVDGDMDEYTDEETDMGFQGMLQKRVRMRDHETETVQEAQAVVYRRLKFALLCKDHMDAYKNAPAWTIQNTRDIEKFVNHPRRPIPADKWQETKLLGP